MDHHGSQEEGGHGHAGDPEGEHGHEGARGRRVVRRLRARHPGHRAAPELLGVLRHLALDGVGDEGRDHMGGARDDADQEADGGPAPDRHVRLAPLLAGGEEVAQREQDLGEAEEPHGYRHHADAVAELGDGIGEAEVAGHLVDADHAQEESEGGHGEALQHRARVHVGEDEES